MYSAITKSTQAYHESAYLSTLMSLPGAATIVCLHTNFTIDLYCVLLVCALSMCTDAEILTDF